jgi:hypothetical protein
MAQQRYLQLVVEGKVDDRIWHWTPELAKDPRMREVFPDRMKMAQALAAQPEESLKPKVVYASRAAGFGEYDILRIIPASAVDEEPLEEVIDHITGAEAANARVEELTFPQGRSDIPAVPFKQEVTPEEARTAAIEDAISSLDEADWGKGPIPYPKVPAVSALTGFQVSFQEIKAVVFKMKEVQTVDTEKAEE